MRILTISATFPSVADPTWGVFVKERMKAVAALGEEIEVLAPVPWVPAWIKSKKWRHFSQFPAAETVDGLPVTRPKYLLPPKVGGYFHPALMYPAAFRAAKEIQSRFDFDVIDAHWLYPSGVVATWIGRKLGKPVMITGRGEDVARFPDMPFKRGVIRRAVKAADHLVGVSQEIADKIVSLGAAPEKVSVVPNGVDCEKFRPLSREEVRAELGLPSDAVIILSVGDCLELKGHHLAVEGMQKVLARYPKAMLVICGGPGRHGRDYTQQIKQTVERLSLGDHVRLVGRRPHSELAKWYSAANLFVLCSSREGLPNVLMEALACGTPALGTTVGGIPDILGDERLGALVSRRDGPSVGESILKSLDKKWDRRVIREVMEQRSWQTTADTVIKVLRRLGGKAPNQTDGR